MTTTNTYGTAPMWGTVSAPINAGIWTMHYERDIRGTAAAITKIGYGPELFAGFTGPVVRYDKASADNLMQCIHGPVSYVVGHHSPMANMMTLDEYLQDCRDHGVPVEQWQG